MSNMYPQSIKQWNPFVGCFYNCSYCKRSFQAQLKRWAKANCPRCYHYTPHHHLERLLQKIPQTKRGEFVFACACSDVTFCGADYLEQIIQVMRDNKNTRFLLQSKNPWSFNYFKFSKNVILGTTIETNRDTSSISLALHPYERYKGILTVKHKTKAVTIEPADTEDYAGFDTRKTWHHD